MPTPYKILSDGVLRNLRSIGYKNITEEEFDDMIYDYIKPATVKFKACKKNLTDRDDLLQQFNPDLDDEETEILINFMFIDYLSANYINVPELLRESLVSKDFYAIYPHKQLEQLQALRKTYQQETRQMVSAYSNGASELFAALLAKRNSSSSSSIDETTE